MPAAAAGTYALSGFESYNPASGILNINLPLLTVKGRGSTSVPILLPVSPQGWTVYATEYTYDCQQYGPPNCETGYGYSVTNAGWDPLPNQYGAGQMIFRSSGDYCSGGSWNTALTRGTFVAPDGTETEFVDQQTGGAPESGGSGYNRGTVFTADDGSFAVFTSSSAITDPTSCTAVTVPASGTLVTRDGTSYTITNGYVTSIRDHNGNITSLSASGITDSLGRSYQFASGNSGGRNYDTIQYPGAYGATRTITVWYANLDATLAPGESIETFGQLWSGISAPAGAPNDLGESYDPLVISEVDLPNGSKYTFTYHSYGDVAQITLPTGGLIQYDYNSVLTWVPDNGYTDFLPVRTLQESRRYINGSLFARTDYLNGNEIDQYDGLGNLLAKQTYTIANTGTAPTSGTNYNAPQYNETTQVNYYDRDGSTLLESQVTTWTQSNSCQVNCSAPQQVTTTMNSMVKQSTYTYDSYNNVNDEKDYDWGSGGPGGLLREISYGYLWQTNSNYSNPSINLVSAPYVQDTWDTNHNHYAETVWHYDENTPQDDSGVIDHDSGYGTGFNTRANVTSVWGWLNTTNGFLPRSLMTHDVAGNVVTVKDGDGNTTSFAYNDNYPDGNRNTYGHLTVVANPFGQMPFQGQYDYNSGQLAVSADIMGQFTTYNYGGSGYGTDHLIQVNYANGAHTYYSYPSTTEVVTQQDQNSSGDAALKSQTLYDELGRETESDTFENSSQYIATTMQYDAIGLLYWQANPSRPGDGLAYQTVNTHDGLGRVTQTQTADGAVSTISYSGNQQTIKDQAGNSRTLTYDGLGRLTSVSDATGTTSYSYDPNGNLTQVMQGSETRTFSYDSLSRLISATNPESGTVSYAYDWSDNVTSRTDARGITTNYSYDALNRLKSKTYSDGTPSATYSYDAGPNGAGHLTSVQNGNSTTNFTSFDSVGNVLASNQVIAGQTYSFAYSYNLAGALTSETYPSGRVVNMAHDGADRVSAVTGNLNGQQTPYVSGILYAPHGAPSFYGYGNQLIRSLSYNSRLQWSCVQDMLQNSPSEYLWYVCPNWGTTNNNGNLQSVASSEGGPAALSSLPQFTESFGYDGTNRLTSASDSGSWLRTFGYDQYGNMWVTGNSGVLLAGNTPTSDIFNGNNQINSATYDAAGNNLTVNGDTLAYDAENMMKSATEPPNLGGATENYLYDGAGERVEKAGPNGTTVYVYDAFWQLAAEYSTAQNISRCATCYLSSDWLGSVRLVTDQNGNVAARHDYLPFGEEIPAGYAGRNGPWGSTSDVDTKFTGQIRDQETGLDYFNARYFTAPLGRFNSADPLNIGADPTDPQTWNGYSYVRNNPLALVDPSGMDTCADGSYADVCVTASPLPPMPLYWYFMNSVPDMYYAWQQSQWSSGGGNTAPQPQKPTQPQQPNQHPPNLFSCASEFASEYSLAGAFQRFGIGTSGVSGFVTNALGGNAFSGLTDLIQSFGSGAAGGHNVFYNMAQGVAAGPTQGFGAVFGKSIAGTPLASGPVDVATTALVAKGFSIATSAGQTIQTLNGVARLGSIGLDAGEFATGVGAVKLAYDAASYGAGLFGCAAGLVN
jgi:RHS repeat-associated protein